MSWTTVPITLFVERSRSLEVEISYLEQPAFLNASRHKGYVISHKALSFVAVVELLTLWTAALPFNYIKGKNLINS